LSHGGAPKVDLPPRWFQDELLQVEVSHDVVSKPQVISLSILLSITLHTNFKFIHGHHHHG
jgi:hypothetical protein